MRSSYRSLLPLVGLVILGIAPSTSAAPPQRTLDQVCLGTEVGPMDVTDAAANSFPRDVITGSTGNIGGGPPAAYYADAKPFHRFEVNVGQPGIGGHLDWYYWDGHAWRSFSVQGGDDLTEAGWHELRLRVPSSWAPFINPGGCGGGALYTVLVATSFGYTVPPIADQVFVR